MESLDKIKNEYVSKNLTKSEINKRILNLYFLKLLCTKTSHYLISLCPFILYFSIPTFLFGYNFILALVFLTTNVILYKRIGEKSYDKDVLPSLVQIKNELIVLNELKKGK